MKKIIKLLFLIPLTITPILLTSCKEKDIERIGKEVGSRVNGENQILIEKLNDIINKQRKEINNLQYEINNKKSEIKRINEEYKEGEKKYGIAQSEKNKEKQQKNEYHKYGVLTQDKEQIHVRELKIKEKEIEKLKLINDYQQINMELNQKLIKKLYDNEKETLNKYDKEIRKEHKEKIEKLNKEIIPKINNIDNEIKKLKIDLNRYKNEIEQARKNY